jgi:predicted aspartyl protease
MTGKVTEDREAVISLRVLGPTGKHADVTAVIDTGFTEALTLPPVIIAKLELPFRGFGEYTLADDLEALLPMHRAAVLWDAKERPVLATAAKGGPLIDMALLQGSRMTMDVIEDGRVQIHAIAR